MKLGSRDVGVAVARCAISLSSASHIQHVLGQVLTSIYKRLSLNHQSFLV